MPTPSDSCPHCKRRGTIRPIRINHWLHFVLMLLTAFIWGLSWLALVLGQRRWPFQCKRCGVRIAGGAILTAKTRSESPAMAAGN
ncbi:MAG TPA: hypothetical protein VGH90_10030 [Chthoniobacteraceae bacterium]